MENNEAIVKELQDGTNHSNGQGGTNGAIDYEAQYKTLQSEFDKRNEERIDLALKLAKKDKKEILELPEKVQKKVIKEIYGLDSLEELKLIHGDRFYEDGENDKNTDDEEDRTTRLERELLLLKHNQAKSLIESGIDDVEKANKELIGSDGIDKLRNELKHISTDLPVKERIERAAKIVFGVNPTDAGYLALRQTNGVNSQSKSSDEEKASTELTEQFAKIFKRGYRK